MLPTSRFQHAAAHHPLPTPALAVSSREWPTLTIYRDGMANLNALATALLCTSATTVGLVPPPPVLRGRLSKAWQLHANPDEGGVPLWGRADRVTLLRFRAAAAAQLLFAEVPATTDRLAFILTPDPAGPTRFRLLPA